MPAGPYAFEFAPAVVGHMQAIHRRWHPQLRDAMDGALRFQPDVRSRNRKPLDEPSAFPGAWELRCGPKNRLRVFYEVHPDRMVVRVLAIGEKIRDRLYIGGEEFEL